ncbi:MAG: DUF2213 domain-containing protein [Rhodococcus sp.]|nr:DUF2213 domain-containing protein [Rhodococcus sp. (in: high G+C Gram-positive bacteria)]
MTEIRLQIDRDSTRKRTPQGWMLADAILARSGVLWYAPSEVGALAAGRVDAKRGLVAVYRTRDSLAHPDTLDSVLGVPITIGHPADGVTPATYQRDAVGTVIGTPRIVDEDGVSYLVATIVIGSDKALAKLEAGTDELSIGYDHELELNDDEAIPAELRTSSSILINHVALVDRGRAGRKVRVQDEGNAMDDKDDIATQVAAALADALPAALKAALAADAPGDAAPKAALAADAPGDAAPTFDTEAVTAAVSKAVLLKPVLDAEAEKAKADGEAAFLKTFDELVDKGVAEKMAVEKARLSVLAEALPFIGGSHADHEDKTAHELLVAAVGDKVPDADSQSDDFLRGALAQMKPGKDKSHIVPNTGKYTGDASAKANSARDEMIQTYQDAHKTGTE